MTDSWNRKEFIKFVVECGVVGFFSEPVTLSSGRTSHWYVNWRTAAGDVALIDRTADYLLAFLAAESVSYDTIYGVPEGATKLAIIAQYKNAMSKGTGERHVLLMGRGRPKEHGDIKDRYFLGDPTGRIVVVEDVTTTGSSLLDAINLLREAGANIAAAVGLTDRLHRRDDGTTVKEALAAKGVAYYAMSTADEVMPLAAAHTKLDDRVAQCIEEEFIRFGSERLTW